MRGMHLACGCVGGSSSSRAAMTDPHAIPQSNHPSPPQHITPLYHNPQVKFGAVDCTAHQATCGQYSVQGYPTIKVFGSNKEAPSEYQGGRDSGSIVGEANKAWAANAKPREVRRKVWCGAVGCCLHYVVCCVCSVCACGGEVTQAWAAICQATGS